MSLTTSGSLSSAPSASAAGPTASIEVLQLRARIVSSIRGFLTARGYWEVETPILSVDTVVDTYIDPIAVDAPAGTLLPAARTFYLQTSPEFGMKRLLAAGSGSIFQIAHAFRQGERSEKHNPEFALVEWYRVGGNYRELMVEVGELIMQLLGVTHPVSRTYQEAFRNAIGLDPFAASDEELRTRAAEDGFESTDRDELLNFLLAAHIEPGLGKDHPCFLYDYPPSQAALAQIDPGPPAVARRFELYLRGTELCNGYQELTDPEELRKRNVRNNARRLTLKKSPLPVESRMLEAMAGLPECAGVALGLDRLVMFATQAKAIDAVIPFPVDRA